MFSEFMVPDIDFAELKQILFDLMKTVKVISVYPENNPIPMKLKESFTYRFSDFIRVFGDLKLTVNRNQLVIGDNVVFQDKSEEESLALLFHNSGITEIKFDNQFETAQANQFFKILKSYINRDDGCEDLVALLWEANIQGFDYQTLDDIHLQNYVGNANIRETAYTADDELLELEDDNVDYNSIFLDEKDADSELSADEQSQERLDDDQMGLNQPGQKTEKLELPELASLLTDAYKLTEEEHSRIEVMIAENRDIDIFQLTSDLIRELLYQESEYNEFLETVTIASKIHSEFIRCGQLRRAGDILSHLQELSVTRPDRSERWNEPTQSALVMAGGWEAVSELGRLLNDFEEISRDELVAYLNHFDWHVLSVLVDLLGILKFREHRFAVCDFLAENGKNNIDIIAKGIFDKRWFVVRNIVSILIAIGGDRAFTFIAKAIDHDEPRVRLNIVKCLLEHNSEKSVILFLRLIWDEDKAVQKAAIQEIGKLTGETALDRMTSILNDKRFETLENSSKKAIIMKYSEIGGKYAVQYLVSLVTRFPGFSMANREFYRKTAFHALAINDSERAEVELTKMTKSWKKSVRLMANEALRVRHEHLSEVARD